VYEKISYWEDMRAVFVFSLWTMHNMASLSSVAEPIYYIVSFNYIIVDWPFIKVKVKTFSVFVRRHFFLKIFIFNFERCYDFMGMKEFKTLQFKNVN